MPRNFPETFGPLFGGVQKHPPNFQQDLPAKKPRQFLWRASLRHAGRNGRCGSLHQIKVANAWPESDGYGCVRPRVLQGRTPSEIQATRKYGRRTEQAKAKFDTRVGRRVGPHSTHTRVDFPCFQPFKVVTARWATRPEIPEKIK